MATNTLGTFFAVTTFGESHGGAIGCVIDGCPPLLSLSEDDLLGDLARRKPGTSSFVTQRKEDDMPEILSGVFAGKTTGAPIAIMIRNQDQRSKDYGEIAEKFRPGHADYTYWHKYGIRDYRGGGRSSARLTAPIVAAGAVAKKWLAENFSITIRAYVSQIGSEQIPFHDWASLDAGFKKNPFNVADLTAVPRLKRYLREIAKSKDSIGARIEVLACNVPVGWGAPLFQKLDANIAAAMMGINAVKGVEIGAGFAAVAQKGSEHNDEIRSTEFLSNHSGGVLGGISSGQDIRVSVAFKPTPSILQTRRTIDQNGQETTLMTKGRHDPCVGLRAPPIVEAMLALVLMDAALQQRAQCGTT